MTLADNLIREPSPDQVARVVVLHVEGVADVKPPAVVVGQAALEDDSHGVSSTENAAEDNPGGALRSRVVGPGS